MRVPTLVFAGIAAVAVVVSGLLWRDLRAEKLTNKELHAQLAQARIPSRQPLLPATVPPPTTTNPAAAPTPGAAPAPQPMTADALRARTTASSVALGNVVSSLVGAGNTEQDLMQDPEYRKARLTQLRIQVARTYPGLAEELGLSAREADQFFNLMAENQLKLTAEISSRAASGAAGVTDLLRNQTAIQKEQEDAIRAMMGNARYEQYQAYQQTRPARQQVVTMGSQLSAAGAPLSDAQSKALTSVMISEQQRQRSAPPALNPNMGQPRTTQSMMEEVQNRQEETNRRVLEAVGPQLNAKQLAVLKEQYEQQNAARRETLSRLQGIEQRLGLPAPGAPPQRP